MDATEIQKHRTCLQKFDMNMIKDHSVILFIGKRGVGKSIDYLYHHREFPLGTVISPTDNHRPHVPPICIHVEYTPELLELILRRQKDVCSEFHEAKSMERSPSTIDPRAFVILDDCMTDDNEWIKDKNIKWIFMNGCFAQITFILTMQYCMGFTPNLRASVDYVFICKETNLDIQRRLYEHYAGMFRNVSLCSQQMYQRLWMYGHRQFFW
jgi:hypothetical protein